MSLNKDNIQACGYQLNKDNIQPFGEKLKGHTITVGTGFQSTKFWY